MKAVHKVSLYMVISYDSIHENDFKLTILYAVTNIFKAVSILVI